jgi:hypothetical protein
MRDRSTHRVCPSCGAVGTAVACDHCGSLTLTELKVTRLIDGEGSSGTALRSLPGSSLTQQNPRVGRDRCRASGDGPSGC